MKEKEHPETKRLEAFREEVRALAAHDEGHILDLPPGEKGPAVVINPESLNLDDMIIWEQIRTGSVSRGDVEFYRDQLIKSSPDESRQAFAQLVIRKGMTLVNEKELGLKRAEENKDTRDSDAKRV
jgi:hypothetical protein